MKIYIIISVVLYSFICAQTAEQIQKLKEIAQKSGMSKSDLIDQAKSKGYSEKQIKNVLKKNEKEKNLQRITQKSLNNDNDKIKSNSEIDEVAISEERKELESDNKNQQILNPIIKKDIDYFGYDIFNRDPSIFQSSSVGAVNPTYLIGPGDEIIVMLWGETQFRQVLTVDREGFVFIPEIGQVFVNGLDLSLLESKLFRVFSQSYASLTTKNGGSTSFLDISLGNLRPLRIQVLGEVSQPGAYTLSPSATLFSSLYYFNGPTKLGSLRDIHLIRGGKKISSIDFYDYLLTGKNPLDQALQLDDVVFIPRRLKSVRIEGEIGREGIYELKENEDFLDLLSIAGNLKVTAYLDRCQINRIVPFAKRKELKMDRVYNDISLQDLIEKKEKIPLQDGDKIMIFSIDDNINNSVKISGSVLRSGDYDIGDSLRINDLINKAGGLLGDTYMDRADIIRLNPDLSKTLMKVDLKKAIDGEISSDLKLQPKDEVLVYRISEMMTEKYVSIQGHVKNDGRFPLQKNMTVSDLIFKAGGFFDDEFKSRAYIEEADLLRLNDDKITYNILKLNLNSIFESKSSSDNFLLEANDIVKIYSKDIFVSASYVTIRGAKNEGAYSFKSNMTLKDLIFEAGGTGKNSPSYKVEVARYNPDNNDLDQFSEIANFDMDKSFSLSNMKTNSNSEKVFGNNTKYFELRPYDIVSIRPNPFFTGQKTIEVLGHVMYPGKYVIHKQNEKVLDILNRAGGLRPNAFIAGTIYTRNGVNIKTSFEKILKNKNSKFNFYVQDKDRIEIFEQPHFIFTSGEVNNPGSYIFSKGKNLKYYLNASGGLNQNADRKNIWVEYPNGLSKRFRRWSIFSPKIIDGSIIRVAKKEETEPFDKTEFAKEVTTIIANFVQVIAMVQLSQ
jgi:polysaccharide biosynthesis/export protein